MVETIQIFFDGDTYYKGSFTFYEKRCSRFNLHKQGSLFSGFDMVGYYTHSPTVPGQATPSGNCVVFGQRPVQTIMSF